jgi:hypothetical protein
MMPLGMTSHSSHSLRPWLGGLALGLGCFGLVLFLIGIPLNIATAGTRAAWGQPHAPQPASALREAAESREIWHVVWSGLVPLFFVSATLLGYGLLEAQNELRRRNEDPFC